MADLYVLAEQQRADLRRRESVAAERLIAAYADVDRAAERSLAKLLDQIAAAQREGRPLPISWLYERDRLSALRREIEAEVARFAGKAEPIIAAQKQAAAVLAGGQALDLIEAGSALPRGARLSLVPLRSELIEQAIAFQAEGSALADLLDGLPAHAGVRVADELVRGVALGRNPVVIAHEIRSTLDGNRARALTIARTETLRTYREASRLGWVENSAVVRGWEWFSTLDRRACPSCWAMHGTEHPLSEPMGTHPSCRCSMVPIVREAIRAASRQEPGPERFARLDEPEQLVVLGPSKLAAYRAGEIGVEDLVAVRRSARWGVTRSETSLAEARLNARARLRAAA